MSEILSSNWFFVVKNIIDILGVAYIIYFLYSLFEDTNSINILKGILILVPVALVADFLDLKALSGIFGYFVKYLMIVLVVLFQPEIRRLFSRLGRSGLSAIRQKLSQETMSEIESAVFAMSAEKTGALIIIEQKVGLHDLIEGATHLDAVVKSEMLQSIFFKNSLLHDGAVIIEGDKIIAARVIIPNIILGKTRKNYGTRHRAGISVTVDTDALAIIVSEETGRVSVAHNGSIQTVTEANFVRRMNEIITPS